MDSQNSWKDLSMKSVLALGLLASLFLASAALGESPLNHKMKDIDGKEVDLAMYKGKVVLFVNVASKCGNTPQYEGLEKLYEKYKDKGFVVIGVPANNFGKQEPGTEAEIKEFCTSKYKVTFPMMSKVSVKGDDIDPLYAEMIKFSDAGVKGDVDWNFAKFLVGKNGELVHRYKAGVKPDDKKLVGAIEEELAK
jgi:glutathione peroxidase